MSAMCSRSMVMDALGAPALAGTDERTTLLTVRRNVSTPGKYRLESALMMIRSSVISLSWTSHENFKSIKLAAVNSFVNLRASGRPAVSVYCWGTWAAISGLPYRSECRIPYSGRGSRGTWPWTERVQHLPTENVVRQKVIQQNSHRHSIKLCQRPNRMNRITSAPPHGFDFVIFDHEDDRRDDDSSQNRFRDVRQRRHEETKSQQHQDTCVDVGHRSLHAAGRLNRTPTEGGRNGHGTEEGSHDVGHT